MLQVMAMHQVLPVVVRIALQGTMLAAAMPPMGGGRPYCLVVDAPQFGSNRGIKGLAGGRRHHGWRTKCLTGTSFPLHMETHRPAH